MKPIRNSAKAIIVRDGKVLCIKCRDNDGFFYGLPGGGQEPGETIIEALHRECMEEISAEIVVNDLRFVREYIGIRHEFAEYDGDVHQIEYMFLCDLVNNDDECCAGVVPDNMQVGIEWLPLDRLEEFRLYPLAMRPYLSTGLHNHEPIYLGAVN